MENSHSAIFSEWSSACRTAARIRLATLFELQNVECGTSYNVEAWRVRIDDPKSEYIRIEVSQRFPLELPDVFVEDSSLYGTVPHIDYRLKLCYCDEDTASIDTSRPAEIAEWVIGRTLEVLGAEHDVDQFASEFTHYWTNSRPFLSLLENLSNPRIVEILHLEQPISKPYQFLVHEDRARALQWLKQSQIGKPTVYSRALFLPNLICATPPYPMTTGDVHKLMKACEPVTRRVWEQFLRESPSSAYILSTVESSRGNTLFGWQHLSLQNWKGQIRGFRPGMAPFSLEVTQKWGEHEKLVRFEGVSITVGRLVSRTTGKVEPRFKHAVLIGAGSLGSNLLSILTTSTQFCRISIIDPDVLKIENVLRHACGFDKVGLYKATALARQIATKCPWVQFDVLPNNVVDILDQFAQLISEADVVILATGCDAIEHFLLDQIFKLRTQGQLVHRIWVTSQAAKGFLARYQVGEQGCHRCIATPFIDETSEIQYEPGCSAGFANYGGSKLSRFISVAADSVLSPISTPYILSWESRSDEIQGSVDTVNLSPIRSEKQCVC